MKNKFLIFKSSVLALGVVAILASCGKDDLSAPSIVLDGDNPIVINLNGSYTDPGFTATDDEDGDVTASVLVDASSVNTAKVGKYTVTYSVTDKAGNVGTKDREVWVKATADDYVAFFNVVEGCAGAIPSYEIHVEKINATTLRVTNLGDFDAGSTVFNIDISGDLNEVLTINDTDDTDPSLSCDATGTLSNGTSGSFTIDMSYTFDDGINPPFSCSDVTITQE